MWELKQSTIKKKRNEIKEELCEEKTSFVASR